MLLSKMAGSLSRKFEQEVLLKRESSIRGQIIACFCYILKKGTKNKEKEENVGCFGDNKKVQTESESVSESKKSNSKVKA